MSPYVSFTLKDHLPRGPCKPKRFDFQRFGPKKGWICCKKPFFTGPNSAGFPLLNSDRLEGGTIKC